MMNPETFEFQVSQISGFRNHREEIRRGNLLNDSRIYAEQNYLQKLRQSSVSELSKFGSSVWDFNSDLDSANVSINCRGCNLRIFWERYNHIPEFVITELKCITRLYYLSPKLFINKDKNGGHIKANTLVTVTDCGLKFLNHLFKIVNDKFGMEYVHESFYSLSTIDQGMFKEAAATYDYVYNPDLKTFLDNLRHPYSKTIVGEMVKLPNPKKLQWKKYQNKGSRNFKVIPESIFEKLVYSSSFLVTDFLISMGEEPADKIAVKHLDTKLSSVKLYSEYGFTKRIFDIYVTGRMENAKYNDDFIQRTFPDLVTNDKFKSPYGNFLACSTIRNRELVKSCGNTFADVKNVIDMIKYSAQYLIAQFTGMRPSEFAHIPLNCIEIEKNVKLIKSKITKGQKTVLNGLFDDKWVVIPAIEDAVKTLQILNNVYHSDKLFSNTLTRRPNAEYSCLKSQTFTHQIKYLIEYAFGKKIASEVDFYSYMTRHTLAYQLFRADLGLPLISYQLKHLIQDAERYTSDGVVSPVTLTYGYIGDKLALGTRGLRKQAEIERVKSTMDPDGVYLGPKGVEHKAKLKNLFMGYMAAGYEKQEVFEAMVEQGIALVNMGTGFCYGGRSEDFDESLPCIGTLRCNPVRCSNAVVTKANAPKWREVYVENIQNLTKPEYAENKSQIQEAINEAKRVLEYLGEPIA